MTLTVQTSPIRSVNLDMLVIAGRDALSAIVKQYGVVYVTSITRDGCSGCEEQKPLFKDLASRLDKAHSQKLSFNNVHVNYSEADTSKSEQAKRILGHGSYPTYMVHIKSQYGPLEHYRASYPTMDELEKQAINALELAEFYEKQSLKAKN
jgi:hypothetical protein